MEDNEKKIREIAADVRNWLENVVSDIAYDLSKFPEDIEGTYGSKMAAKFRKAKKEGMIDIQGWLADELYNNKDVIKDIIGDRIFDGATEIVKKVMDPDHDKIFVRICIEMKKKCHAPLERALNELIRDAAV